MPLVRRRREALSLEDMPQMTATVGAHNFRPDGAKASVLVPRHGAGDAVKVGRPAAARVELVRGLVKRRVASGTGVDALLWVVLVVLSGAGRFSSLFSEDSELCYGFVSENGICICDVTVSYTGGWTNLLGLRMARHSSSLRWSG